MSARDLTEADLPSCSWAGSAVHLAQVGRVLVRARRGEGVRYETTCVLMRKTL